MVINTNNAHRNNANSEKRKMKQQKPDKKLAKEEQEKIDFAARQFAEIIIDQWMSVIPEQRKKFSKDTKK